MSDAPDLQVWVELYGGWLEIPFDEWDRAVAEYQADRRAELKRNKTESSFIWPELVKRIKI
jgi:hypothetical protein